MPNPRLLHPILVTIQQIDHTETLLNDPFLRQSVGPIGRSSNVQLYAQIEDMYSNRAVMTDAGLEQHFDGYALFRTVDLQDASITLKVGDRISVIGEGVNARAKNVYIIKLEYLGHYPNATGATLLKAYYQDRSPSRL